MAAGTVHPVTQRIRGVESSISLIENRMPLERERWGMLRNSSLSLSLYSRDAGPPIKHPIALSAVNEIEGKVGARARTCIAIFSSRRGEVEWEPASGTIGIKVILGGVDDWGRKIRGRLAASAPRIAPRKKQPGCNSTLMNADVFNQGDWRDLAKCRSGIERVLRNRWKLPARPGV